MKLTCMLLTIGALPGLRTLRTSPDLPDAMISSIRSGVVLPGNRLVRLKSTSCDSFSGPFCDMFGDSAPFLVGGLIDRGIWGDVKNEAYKKAYSKLSEYAQHHWSGSATAERRETRLTRLSPSDNGSLELSPHMVEMETSGFSPLFNSSALYIVNSLFGYISFIKQEVSVVDLKVRAPLVSHALVRAYRSGVPVWSRMIEAESISDVARPCSAVDPSLESVDYLEIIGEGAKIESLEVSLGVNNRHRNYMFLDEDLSHPSRYYGIRSFTGSAFLMDMDQVLREGWVVRGDLPDKARSAWEETVFKYETFVKKMATTPLEKSPLVQMEVFIGALQHRISTKRDIREFTELFTEVLLDSTPELIAFVLSTKEFEPDTNLNPFLTRLYAVRTGLEEQSSASTPTDPVLATIAASLSNITKMNFRRFQHSSADDLLSTANRLVQVLYAHLGDEKFTEIAIQSKLKRLAQTQPVASDGIDEDALAEILIQGLELPINPTTPMESRKEILSKIVKAVSPEQEHADVEQLVEILSNYP